MEGLFQTSSATRPSYIKGVQENQSALNSSGSKKYSNIDTFNIQSVRSKAQWKYEDLPYKDQNQFGGQFNSLFDKQRSNTSTSFEDMSNFKSQSRVHSTLLNTKKEYGDPHMASPSKLFQIKDKQQNNLIIMRIQTIGGSMFESAQPKSNFALSNNKYPSLSNSQSDKNLGSSILQLSKRDTQKSFMSKRMDNIIPYEFLVDLARQLDHCDEQSIHTLSQPQAIILFILNSYVNELLKLSTTINRTLKSLPHLSHKV